MIERILWNHKWGLSLTAGVLLGLSYAPFPLPFLAIAAFILLYRLTYLCGSVREVILYAYPSFIIWNLITTYWLMLATVAGGIAAIVANSGIMLIPLLMQRRILMSKHSPWLTVPLAAAPWVAYEWLHLIWDLAWPWLALANAFSTATWAVQYIEFTGYLSITFWILCVSGWFYTALQSDRFKTYWYAAAGLAAMLPVLLSLIILSRFYPEPDRHINVVVAQPNYDSYLPIAGYSNSYDPLVELIELSDSARTDDTDLIIWPENAIMGGVSELSRSRNDALIQQKSREWSVPVIGGASWYQYYLEEELPRVHRTDNSGRPFNVYNSAVGYYPDGSMEVYNKVRLVPIVERMPFVHQMSYIPFLDIDWGEHSGYGKGRRIHLFKADKVKVPAVVCYDSVFPSLIRDSVVKGAGFISVITNDGWWGNTSGHVQHYEFARLRAIETRRAVVRSANNGISGMINPDGSPHSRSEYWTRTAFELTVPVYSSETFYVRTGEWFGWLMLISGLTGWGFLRFQRYRD